MKPELKLDLLKEIKAAVGIPLVLHGGSGNPDDEIARVRRSSASTRSTSPATSRSPTTTRCARSWHDTRAARAELRSSRRAIAAMKETARAEDRPVRRGRQGHAVLTTADRRVPMTHERASSSGSAVPSTTRSTWDSAGRPSGSSTSTASPPAEIGRRRRRSERARPRALDARRSCRDGVGGERFVASSRHRRDVRGPVPAPDHARRHQRAGGDRDEPARACRHRCTW